MRIRTWPILAVALCLGAGVPAGAQSRGFKSYKTHSDYCFDNPKAPTCVLGKTGGLTTPMKLPPIGGPIYRPPARSSAAPSVSQTANATMVRLDEPDWRFAHPGADLLAGFNFSDMAQSKLVRSVLLKLAGGESMAADQVDRVLEDLGDIQHVVLSVQGRDVLVLLKGRMERPASSIEGGMIVRRLDSDAFLVGKEASVNAAQLGRMRLTPSTLPVETQWARRLWMTSDVWLTESPAVLRAFGSMMRTSPQASKLTGFSMGLTLRDGLRTDVWLKAPTAADAQAIVAASTRTPAAVEGTMAHLTYVLDAAQAEAGAAEMAESPLGKQLGVMIAAARQIAPSEGKRAPKHPGVIVIDGLGDGPKSVPVVAGK